MAKLESIIKFISPVEERYVNNEISLQEMARKIYNGFIRERWVDDSEAGLLPVDYKLGTKISSEELYDLFELVQGTLHTIAFMDKIFEEGETLPTINDYDYWKQDLYDWADSNKVWIKPRY